MNTSNELKVRASATFLHPGNRAGQEDQVLVVEDKRIFVVADGFGGPVPGSRASQTACDSVKRFLIKEAGDLDATLPFELRSYFSLAGNVLFNALIHANKKVNKLNKGLTVHERGGASVLAGYMDGCLLALAGVGACSAWLFRNGAARELVTPRTYARLCDPFQPEARQDLLIPLMAMGISGDLEPEIFEYQLREGDWLMFQTDGLTVEARGSICALQAASLEAGQPPDECVRDVIQALNECHFDDNAAASLIIF